jgi:hypothetical protein
MLVDQLCDSECFCGDVQKCNDNEFMMFKGLLGEIGELEDE